jgi:hypothetical protein
MAAISKYTVTTKNLTDSSVEKFEYTRSQLNTLRVRSLSKDKNFFPNLENGLEQSGVFNSENISFQWSATQL